MLLGLCGVASAQTYRTQVLSPEIHTIQINANGNWQSYPVIDLNSSDYIQLNFDKVSENYSRRLKYKLVHCNADWSASSLSEIEYIDGFNDNLIEDYALSARTSVDYMNFILPIPNNDLQLKVSGNYAILVYDEDAPDKILLTACFSVLESKINIGASVSANTDIDISRENQQVSFSLNYGNLKMFDPQSELKTYVRQNNRLDNQKLIVKPTFIQNNKLIFEHNRDLIFEAGNEYRRFESVSYRYNGLNVERTVFNDPYYHTYIYPSKSRANNVYSYDQDQAGRFYIRNSEVEAEYYDTESDYFFTTFTLQMDSPLTDDVYVNGYFTNNSFSNTYKMIYDEASKIYTLTLLLKQGAYNYQYLTKKGNLYSTRNIEGNYSETENEYSIMVYHRPPGQRYDSLVGFNIIRYNK